MEELIEIHNIRSIFRGYIKPLIGEVDIKPLIGEVDIKPLIGEVRVKTKASPVQQLIKVLLTMQ